MKKFLIIAFTFLLSVSLIACGRMKNESTIPATTQPSTGLDITPDMQPMETNIPDPNVDTSMPIYTDGTEMIDPSNPTVK